ncbi:unnamed protein product [Paramecium sonneborni]|uniref:ABC transporter family protein n=1 Tax=Paramecium sonneborni TaxID=65129 RepID=A0A8S1NHG8_9CILI|nr:unnamed protein product [Paramecium sonneborni]
MKISDPLLEYQEVQTHKDDWLYTKISKMIRLINNNREQLQNQSLQEYCVKISDSNYILKQYSNIDKKTIYSKIKQILITNSIFIFIQQIFASILQLANIVMLDLFTDSVKDENNYYILYLILLLIFSFSKTYLVSIQTHQISVFLAKLDVLCNYELYKKLLATHQHVNDQKIPNINILITNDIEQIKQLHFSLKEGTLACCMLIGCILFLYYKDVHAGNVILIVIVCAQVFNFFVTFFMMQAQERMFYRKDQRINLTTDVLHGIKQIKYLSWEQIFSNKIMFKRKIEFQMLIIVKIFDGLLVLFWNNINYILLYFYILNSKVNLIDLNVFTLIAIFNSMIYPLGILPFCINFLLSAIVSIKRVNTYFTQMDVLDISQNQLSGNNEFILQIQEGIYQLSEDFSLQISNLLIKKQSLNFIVGPLGSGKSTLFNAILNELQNIKEKQKQIGGSISFCSQSSWIQNQTIRQNICFGSEYNQQLFTKVVELCQLKEDIQKLENFDQYLVGPDGNNLSGGQKQRIALARAVYQDSDIYLFDDIFSSLDIPVADSIFQNLILNYLNNKTVLFITSNQHFINKIPKNANIIFMEKGQITEQNISESSLIRKLSKKSDDLNIEDEQNEKKDENNDQVQELEEREVGEVDIKVWLYYFSSMAWPLVLLYFIFNFSLQGACSYIDFWLKNENFDNDFSKKFTQLLLIALSVTVFRALFYVLVSLRSSWTIYKQLNDSIMKAKMVFFDKTNAGRIINRLSGDIETIDGLLPWSFDIFMEALARGSGFVIGLIILFPYISVGLIGVFYAYYYVANTYIKTNRELKRLKQVNHAELLGWINETQKGLKTIRAQQKQTYFFNYYLDKLRIWNSCEQSSLRAKFWYFVRLNLTCNLLLLLSTVIILISNENYASKALALTYSILIIDNFNDLFNFYLQAEQMIISVERIRQYSKIPQEDIHKKNSLIKTINFDNSCDLTIKPIVDLYTDIEFKEICLSYDQINYQLKSLNLKIQKNEKIAIIGRTGSGKTSIMNVLFQLYQQQQGNLIIKGQDVQYLSLQELRSQLSIVPQFGFLFEGTLYENLDPGLSIGKEKIDHLLSQFKQLKSDQTIEQGGNNLSNGEKQLINYLRIILQDKSIICLDEATSNIDPQTDKLLHEFLFKFTEQKTLIVITHRLDYLNKYDRVIYLDQGRILKIESIGENKN